MNNDVTYYGHWICPFALRVEFALNQRAIPYDTVELPPTAARPKGFVVPPEFIEHSPRGEIPMVKVGDEYLADSIPIMCWLEEVRDEPGLLPADPERRRFVLDRVDVLHERLMGPTGGIYYGTDPGFIAAMAQKLADGFAEIDAWLADSDWLAGDDVTLAEAIVMPIYVRIESLRPLGFTQPLPERIEAHLIRCRELPGFRATAWTQDQHDEFVGRMLKHRELANR